MILVLSARPSRNDGGDDVSRRGGRGVAAAGSRLVPGSNVRAPRTFTFCLFLLFSLSSSLETGAESESAAAAKGGGKYEPVISSYTLFIHLSFSASRLFNMLVSSKISRSTILQSRAAGGGDGGGTTAADDRGGGSGGVEVPPFFFLVVYLLREVPRLFFL